MLHIKDNLYFFCQVITEKDRIFFFPLPPHLIDSVILLLRPTSVIMNNYFLFFNLEKCECITWSFGQIHMDMDL